MSIWTTMSQIDIRPFQEQKQGFTYLSWSHALRLLKEHVPHARVTKHTFDVNGVLLPYMRDEQGFAYVMVTVDLGEGDVTTEIMPVLNHANRPITNPNSFEVNAQLQRCMAKAISMSCGLGIHLYSGEDIPRPVEAVGADSSAQQTATGSTSATAGSSVKSNEPTSVVPTGAGVHTPKKAFDKKQLHQMISVAPDEDSLKDLYNKAKTKMDIDQFDLSIFTARKKELNFNG